MTPRHAPHRFSAAIVLAAATVTAAPTSQTAPLAMDTARVTIAGTSNIRPYSAWTDTVRLTRVKLVAPVDSDAFWDDIVKPGAIEHFDVAIPAATLRSDSVHLDRNLYKALKLEANRDITFRLAQLERGATGTLVAVGMLRVAGVEREVVLRLETERRDATLVVSGTLAVLMTDYGITPPTAMLGMLKADPKVTITFEVALSVPST